MCTHITATGAVVGAGKAGSGWFPLNEVSVGYDHATQGSDEHAVLLDFVNYDLGLGARVAVELDLQSGRVLRDLLNTAIARAEATGLH